MTLVYRYGLLRLRDDLMRARVLGQMRAAHDYRNVLNELERERRSRMRTAMYAVQPDIAELEVAFQRVDAAAAEAARSVKKDRAARRARKADDSAINAQMCARAARKAALTALREARQRIAGSDAFRAHADEINTWASEQRRARRAACQCYWGTYQLVEDAARQSAAQPLFDRGMPANPHFVRWRGEGAVSAQIIAGMSVDELLGGQHTQVRIDPVDPRAHDPTAPRGLRRRLARTKLHLRVGSDGKRAPIWATWAMVMHRPLPLEARIKRATVSLRRCGPDEEWSLELTVDVPAAPPREPGARIGIDLGWRLLPDGSLRVATWADDSGRSGHLVLSADDESRQSLLRELAIPDEIRSRRDREHNDARQRLRLWLDEEKRPDWLAEACEHLAQWRTPARLAALVQRWGQQRIDGDRRIFEALTTWRYHDWHLWRWECHQRVGALRWRREIYRRWCAAIAEQYAEVAIEGDFDLRRLAARPDSPDGAEETRLRRVRASVSELRLCLRNAVTRRGGRIASVSAKNTTRACGCGHINAEWNTAAAIEQTCAACGQVHDQDELAARNILREQPGGKVSPRPTRSGDAEGSSRWSRARARAAERKSRAAALAERTGNGDATAAF